MPKVLRIINRLNLGGPTFNAAYLSKFQAPEFETLLLSGEHDATEASSEFIVNQLGLSPKYVKGMGREISPVKDRKAYKYIRQVIREYQPDIVHTHAAKAGALGRLAAHHEKVPIILHTFHGHVFHSYFHPAKTQAFLQIERYLARKSTRIIAISRLQKKELTEDFNICPADKMEIIPLGFDLDRFQENIEEKRLSFRAEFQVKPKEVAIGIIGRLVPIKNHSLFLHALKSVLNRAQTPIKAFIVGDGELRNSLELEAKLLEIPYSKETDASHGEPLVFTSWRKDIDRINAGLDVIALTSKNEGTPVSLIEAQAANKPIVSTRVGGIEDIVQEGIGALLSDSEDVETLGNNMLQLVEDQELRTRMGVNGYEFVRKAFSYQRLVKDMNQLYKQLLTEKD
ncbi:MAG: glycosyltransferase [Bacteroidota bacterium]